MAINENATKDLAHAVKLPRVGHDIDVLWDGPSGAKWFRGKLVKRVRTGRFRFLVAYTDGQELDQDLNEETFSLPRQAVHFTPGQLAVIADEKSSCRKRRKLSADTYIPVTAQPTTSPEKAQTAFSNVRVCNFSHSTPATKGSAQGQSGHNVVQSPVGVASSLVTSPASSHNGDESSDGLPVQVPEFPRADAPPARSSQEYMHDREQQKRLPLRKRKLSYLLAN